MPLLPLGACSQPASALGTYLLQSSAGTQHTCSCVCSSGARHCDSLLELGATAHLWLLWETLL